MLDAIAQPGADESVVGHIRERASDGLEVDVARAYHGSDEVDADVRVGFLQDARGLTAGVSNEHANRHVRQIVWIAGEVGEAHEIRAVEIERHEHAGGFEVREDVGFCGVHAQRKRAGELTLGLLVANKHTWARGGVHIAHDQERGEPGGGGRVHWSLAGFRLAGAGAGLVLK